MRFVLLILVCAVGFCACEKTRNTDIMWVKDNHIAQQRCEDGHYEKALRELTLAIDDEKPEDARYAAGLLHLGFLHRALKRDGAADSLIARSIVLCEGALRVAPAWRARPGRWIKWFAPNRRSDVVEALGVSQDWYPLWQSILGATHADIKVLSGVIAAMQQMEGNYAVSDSLFSSCITDLAKAGPKYRECVEIFTQLWIRPGR